MTVRAPRRRRHVAVVALLVGLLAAPAAVAAPLPYESAVRLDAGSGRTAAIQVSQALYPGSGSAGAVVLAREDTFPDALGASALTTDVDGPLLLTPPDRLAADTRQEIARVLGDGGTVYLLGGAVALTAEVERALDELGYRTPRFPGADRVETAAMIARFVGAGPDDDVLLVRAAGNPDVEQGWVDSVSCGGHAAATTTPVLLTPTESATVADESLRTLGQLGARRVHVCGGPLAVPESQLEQLRAAGYAVERHAGENRAATAVAVATGLWDVPTRDGRTFVLVPGYGARFAYGLVAAPLSAALRAPILLVDESAPTTCDDDRVGDTLCFLATGSAGAEGLVVVGGTGIVSDDVLVAAAEAADLAKDDSPPSVPSGLVGIDRPEDDGTTLDVQWKASTGETGPVTYTLYVRRTDAAGALTRANSTALRTTDTTRTLRNLSRGVSYDLAVDAVDAFGNRSALSPVVTAVPTDEVPEDPSVLGVTARDGGGLLVDWPNAPEADVVSYQLQRRSAEPPLVGPSDCEVNAFEPDWATLATIDVPTSQYADADVDASSDWCYRYRLVDSTGNRTGWSPPALWIAP